MHAFTDFEQSMDAVFELFEYHDTNRMDLDSRDERFRKSVRRWNPKDSDQAISDIFDTVDKALIAKDEAEGRIVGFREIADDVDAAINKFSTDPNGFGVLYYRDIVATYTFRSRTAKVREALLTSAVGAFDALMSAIMLGYANIKPESMFESTKKYRLCDIAKFDSLDELVSQHALAFVRDKSFESVADWFEWLGKGVDLPMSRVTTEESRFIEIFLRRNLVVHAGGLVNEIYLAKLPSDLPVPGLNKRLGVGRKYLVQACHLLLAAGFSAYAHFIAFYEAAQDEPAVVDGFIANNSFRLLSGGRLDAVAIYRKCVRHLCENDVGAVGLLDVNHWIAAKQLGSTEDIRAEVEAWDTAALPQRYSLARLILLDRLDEALALANDLIAAGELRMSDWYDWPLLEGLRKRAAENPDACTFLLQDSTADEGESNGLLESSE